MFIISAHLTKFRFTILAAVALLAVVGALVALPDSAEAGRRPEAGATSYQVG